MEIKPIKDWVYIKREPMKHGAIILSEDDSGIGEVVAVGEKAEGVKPGDRVQWDALYGAGHRYGNDYLFIKCSDIWLVHES